VLLVACLYVFSIIFTMKYHEQRIKNTEPEHIKELSEEYFGSLWISFNSLFIYGTMLDDVTGLMNVLRKDAVYMVTFYVFMILSSFTILNMLIGVLAEVVDRTAKNEKEDLAIHEAQAVLQELLDAIDKDQNGTISHREFSKMMKDKRAVKALENIGIQKERVHELSIQIFGDEDEVVPDLDMQLAKRKSFDDTPGKELCFTEFFDAMMSLRPENAVSVRDIASLRESAGVASQRFDEEVTDLDKIFQSATSMVSKALASSEAGQCHGSGDNLTGSDALTLADVSTHVLLDEINRRLRGGRLR
jgi:hypothetical protein